LVRSGAPRIKNNNIFQNGNFDLQVEGSVSILAALDNWWGTDGSQEINTRIKGPVSYGRILNAPYPGGQPIEIKLVKRTDVTAEKPKRGEMKKSYPIDDRSAMGLLEQAKKNIKEGKTEEASNLLHGIVKAQPENHEAWFFLGLADYQAGRPVEALKSISTAVELSPNSAGYRYNLGLTYNETGNLPAAIEEWRKVMALEPQNQNAKMLLELYEKRMK
jgi:Flp pilus assembly protein TadD